MSTRQRQATTFRRRRASRDFRYHITRASALLEQEADSLLNISGAERLRSWAWALLSFSRAVDVILRGSPHFASPSASQHPESQQVPQ